MACKVFRDVRLGLIEQYPLTTSINITQYDAHRTISTIMFGGGPQESAGSFSDDDELRVTELSLKGDAEDDLPIAV